MASPFLFLIILIFLPFLLLFVVLIFLVRPFPAKIPIANRHVFITGGSSGIGFALALKTASEGARVSILARNRNKLEESRKAILLATGVEIGVYSADVRDPEAVQEVIDSVGEIDVLVVNHGVFLPRELDEEELEEVRFMVEVNVMGSFHVIKAALKGMKRRGTGRGPRSIAIMSSQAGQVGVYGYTAYCASKFALRGLGEALQQEVIEDDIHVSIIFPPDTKTPGLDLGLFAN